jgi:hypothetical protein
MESKIEKGEKVASFFLDPWWGMSEYKNCGIYFRTIIKLAALQHNWRFPLVGCNK